MHTYGFSTGALAQGDFRRALTMLAPHEVGAIELSALRAHELPELMRAVRDINLSSYRYVSVHAPSRFDGASEAGCADQLRACIDLDWPVVLHPDVIEDAGVWSDFGHHLCLENMDKRKSDGRTREELDRWFERLPDARFCLDLAHARQVDPTLILARELISAFGDRAVQIHLSELDVRSRHRPLTMGAVGALKRVSGRLRPLAVILESCVEETEIGRELEFARMALEPTAEVRQ